MYAIVLLVHVGYTGKIVNQLWYCRHTASVIGCCLCVHNKYDILVSTWWREGPPYRCLEEATCFAATAVSVADSFFCCWKVRFTISWRRSRTYRWLGLQSAASLFPTELTFTTRTELIGRPSTRLRMHRSKRFCRNASSMSQCFPDTSLSVIFTIDCKWRNNITN